MNRLLLVFPFMMAVTLSCEERISWPQPMEDSGLIAVEGVLTNELTNHVIKLSYPYKEGGGFPLPVSGATVEITDGSVTYLLAETPTGSGQYETMKMRAVFGKTYTLHIQVGGKDFFAQDRSVPVEPMNPIGYQKTEINPSLYRLLFNKSGSDPNYVDHLLDWQTTSFCTPGDSCGGHLVYYDLKTIDVNEVFKPGKEEILFPAGTLVVRRKYSTSPVYQGFLRTVLSETEWRGGVFDVQRANVSTNLSKGAIGFFAVSTVVSDTTLIAEKP